MLAELQKLLPAFTIALCINSVLVVCILFLYV